MKSVGMYQQEAKWRLGREEFVKKAKKKAKPKKKPKGKKPKGYGASY